jgi:hypothetical protein
MRRSYGLVPVYSIPGMNKVMSMLRAPCKTRTIYTPPGIIR